VLAETYGDLESPQGGVARGHLHEDTVGTAASEEQGGTGAPALIAGGTACALPELTQQVDKIMYSQSSPLSRVVAQYAVVPHHVAAHNPARSDGTVKCLAPVWLVHRKKTNTHSYRVDDITLTYPVASCKKAPLT
jgi:hypothetical protein